MLESTLTILPNFFFLLFYIKQSGLLYFSIYKWHHWFVFQNAIHCPNAFYSTKKKGTSVATTIETNYFSCGWGWISLKSSLYFVYTITNIMWPMCTANTHTVESLKCVVAQFRGIHGYPSPSNLYPQWKLIIKGLVYLLKVKTDPSTK